MRQILWCSLLNFASLYVCMSLLHVEACVCAGKSACVIIQNFEKVISCSHAEWLLSPSFSSWSVPRRESSSDSAANIYDWLRGSLVLRMFHIHPTVSIQQRGNPRCLCCCDNFRSRSVYLHIVYLGPDEAVGPCGAKSHTPPGLWVKRWHLHVWCTGSNVA